jgi:hypothetical protein
LRQAAYRPVFVGGAVDVIFGAQQAAQQEGTLGHAACLSKLIEREHPITCIYFSRRG